MDEELKKILFRVLMIPIALAVAAIVLKIKKKPLKEFFAFRITSGKDSLYWLVLFIPVFALGEIWYFGFGLNEGRVWDYPLNIMLIRMLGIIILAPITEELVFRGALFKAIADSRPGPIGAVILTTIIFTASHFQYGIMDLVPIFIDALYWGWVRYKTNSTFLPVIMHMFANSIAVVEFLWIN